MSKKKLILNGEFVSIHNDPKWLVKIEIEGFSSRKQEENAEIYNKIHDLVTKYNKEKIK